jgi:4-hydroxybenzoate polyprenyltransferase
MIRSSLLFFRSRNTPSIIVSGRTVTISYSTSACSNTRNGSSCCSNTSSSTANLVLLVQQSCRWFSTSSSPTEVLRRKRYPSLYYNYYANRCTSTKTTTTTNAAATTSWINAIVPSSLQPYARLLRLDKPVGTMLLLWPCTWSTAMAAVAVNNGSLLIPSVEIWKLLGLFTVGSVAMRGAGCIINDMWDRKYDAQVERTKDRPLASGEIGLASATAVLATQLGIGLSVLYYLPPYSAFISLASLPLVITYPLMKRYTNMPQLVLGLTFNWGILVGWAAVQNTLLHPSVLPLYLSGVTWTLVYDTLYAHQDKKDDVKLGLKSTAIYFGDTYTKPILTTFATISMGGWCLAGYSAGILGPVYVTGCTIAFSHLLWQIYTAKLHDPTNLAKRFQSNNYVGGIVFLSILTAGSTING